MSLTLQRTTGGDIRPVFVKVLELFTGGFSFSAAALARHTEGVTLPKGALLQVNEATRECTPVKRARLAARIGTGVGTAIFQEGHLFEPGDFVWINGVATAATIGTVTSLGNGTDRITTARGWLNRIAALPANAWVVNVGTSAATGIATRVANANTIARYPSTIQAGASVAALRRGTVYANRVNPIVDTDNLPGTIILSTSA